MQSFLNTLKNNQRGQALTETLFVFVIFMALSVGIQQTSQMQMSAVFSLLESTRSVFKIALGSGLDRFAQKINSSFLQSAHGITDGSALTNELMMTHAGFFKAVSPRQAGVNNHHNVYRYSYIESGTGYAESDLNVQMRIGQSARIWRDAYDYSRNIIQPIESLTSKTDAVWKRHRLNSDFLKPWAGVVPEAKKTGRRE